jgi:hypothetical protein
MRARSAAEAALKLSEAGGVRCIGTVRFESNLACAASSSNVLHGSELVAHAELCSVRYAPASKHLHFPCNNSVQWRRFHPAAYAKHASRTLAVPAHARAVQPRALSQGKASGRRHFYDAQGAVAGLRRRWSPRRPSSGARRARRSPACRSATLRTWAARWPAWRLCCCCRGCPRPPTPPHSPAPAGVVSGVWGSGSAQSSRCPLHAFACHARLVRDCGFAAATQSAPPCAPAANNRAIAGIPDYPFRSDSGSSSRLSLQCAPLQGRLLQCQHANAAIPAKCRVRVRAEGCIRTRLA